MSIRTEKVASVIMEALSEPLRRIASEIRAGLITVTSVKMSPDLQIGKHVASRVQLRFAPELRFYRDETMDAMEQIQNLVEQTKKNDRLRDGHASE